MVTPEQKAKQLVDKYMHLFSVELENSIAKYEAAECAKVFVNELLENNFLVVTLKKNYFKGDEPSQDNYEFWLRVKKELEKY